MRTLISGVAVATAAAGLALSVPGPAQAAGRTPWHVTIHTERPVVTLGQKVRLTGKVSRAAAGTLVRLYDRPSSAESWHYLHNALVRRDGTYRTSDIPSKNTQRQYRVVMPKTQKHREGVSAVVTVDVYGWVPLTSYPSANQSYLDVVPSVSINGVSFPSSLAAVMSHDPDTPATQSIEFNVNHQCTRFQGTFGMSDASASGSQASVSAEADGASWFIQTFNVGESQPNTFTFTTAPLKLRFQTASLVAGLDGLGAVGTPEVYCEQ
jgi:hypothetical protein